MQINDYIPKFDEETKIKYAKEFCEGCKELESLLLFLWNNDINTKGCCAGHVEKNTLPYIGIKDLKFSDDFLEYLIDQCEKQLGESVYCSSMSKNCVYDRDIGFYLDNNKNFAVIQKIIETALGLEKKSFKYDSENEFIKDLIKVFRYESKLNDEFYFIQIGENTKKSIDRYKELFKDINFADNRTFSVSNNLINWHFNKDYRYYKYKKYEKELPFGFYSYSHLKLEEILKICEQKEVEIILQQKNEFEKIN